jgi:osmotically-inducible protein OsmY
MQVSDAQIKQTIEEIYKKNNRVDDKEVQVEVQNSRVTLRGEVDSTIEKRHARNLAEDVEGVERVIDEMKVKNFVRRPDNELEEEVRHALLRDAYVEGATIEVRASNGEIQLDGNVPTYHTRKSAEDVAWWTPGVINVENLLLVTEEDFVDTNPLEVPNA